MTSSDSTVTCIGCAELHRCKKATVEMIVRDDSCDLYEPAPIGVERGRLRILTDLGPAALLREPLPPITQKREKSMANRPNLRKLVLAAGLREPSAAIFQLGAKELNEILSDKYPDIEDWDDDDVAAMIEECEKEEKPSKKTASKKTASKKEEKPARRRRSSKKVEEELEEEEEESEEESSDEEESEEEAEEEAKPAPKTRGRGRRSSKKAEEAPAEEEAEKKPATRRRRSSKKTEEAEEEVVEKKPATRRGRRSKKVEETSEEEAPAPSAPATKDKGSADLLAPLVERVDTIGGIIDSMSGAVEATSKEVHALNKAISSLSEKLAAIDAVLTILYNEGVEDEDDEISTCSDIVEGK
jgi:hypothetical protein